MRSCMLQWKADSPTAVAQDSGRAVVFRARSRHATVVLSTLVRSSGCRQSSLITETNGHPQRHWCLARAREMRHCIFNYGDSLVEENCPKTGLDPSQPEPPMPSCGHVWRRLSNIALTNVRWRCFPCKLLSSEFTKMRQQEALLCPSSSFWLKKTECGLLNDVKYTNKKKTNRCKAQ